MSLSNACILVGLVLAISVYWAWHLYDRARRNSNIRQEAIRLREEERDRRFKQSLSDRRSKRQAEDQWMSQVATSGNRHRVASMGGTSQHTAPEARRHDDTPLDFVTGAVVVSLLSDSFSGDSCSSSSDSSSSFDSGSSFDGGGGDFGGGGSSGDF